MWNLPECWGQGSVRHMSALTLYVLLGALAAGFVQGLSGFAFGLVAMTFWVWVVVPQVAGPLVVFGSLVGQLLSLGSFRRSVDGQRLWPSVLGGCVGTPIACGCCDISIRPYSKWRWGSCLWLTAR